MEEGGGGVAEGAVRAGRRALDSPVEEIENQQGYHLMWAGFKSADVAGTAV